MGSRSSAAAIAWVLLTLVVPAADAVAEEACVVLCDAPPSTTTTTAAPPAVPPTTVAPAPAPDPDGAADLLGRLLNDERAAIGLAPVTVRADMGEIARSWSRAMATTGTLAHNDDWFTDDVRTQFGAVMLGENVAAAGSVEQAHRALMDSPSHRDNILDARFTAVGVGAEVRDGRWWFTQEFAQLRPSGPAPSEVPPTTAAAPSPRSTPTSTAASASASASVPMPTSTVASPDDTNLVAVPALGAGTATRSVRDDAEPDRDPERSGSSAVPGVVGVGMWVMVSAAVARRLRGAAAGGGRGGRRAGGARRR